MNSKWQRAGQQVKPGLKIVGKLALLTALRYVNPFAPSPRRHYFIPRVTRLASRLSSGSSATASSIFSGRRATDLTAQPATPAGP